MFKILSPIRGATLAFICLLCSTIQPIARAGDQVPFHASYSNELAAAFSALPLVGVTSQGWASVAHLGNVTAPSLSETVNLATGEGFAVHEFTAANGDTLRISFHLFAI